jgi:hypothetical protein
MQKITKDINHNNISIPLAEFSNKQYLSQSNSQLSSSGLNRMTSFSFQEPNSSQQLTFNTEQFDVRNNDRRLRPFEIQNNDS